MKVCNLKGISLFLNQNISYVVGIQKSPLNETGLLSIQNNVKKDR